VIAASILGFFFAAYALPAQAAKPSYKVKIEAPRAIRKLLEQHLDLARFAKRSDVGDEQLEFLITAAPRQVRSLVETQGYFSPVVRTDTRTDDGRKMVVVSVDPGRQTLIGKVALSFSGPVLGEDPGQEAATRAAFSLASGQPFTQSAWDEAKNDSLAALKAKRYLGAKIARSQARIDPATHVADLSVAYDSGPTFTMGKVEASGLRRYPEKIIANVNPLSEGELYSAERVLELQRQVQNTPYFASVAVDVASDPAKPLETPVHVKVSEYQYNSIRTGVGYSSDLGAHVQGQYSYLNVFNRAWAFTVSGRLEQNQQYGSLQLSMPPDEHAWINSLITSYTRTDVENTQINSVLAGVQRTRTSQAIDYSYSLRFYEDHLSQNVGPSTLARALVPAWAWTRRNVDDPIFPRKGNLLGVEVGFAVKGLLTDQTFARGYVHGRQYFPIGKRDLVLLRAELGGVFTSGGSSGIPASLLFRAGGAASVRGYSYDSIGNNVAGSVLPAKYLVTGGAEYQHWFDRDWGAAVFYDVGTAADTWGDKTFFQGVGVGARWRSPVGPVNVDLAYGLHDRSIRPYLTLGIAF
jgi:translocation and assembly module TamA